jgi:hypothetical protein
MPSTSKTKLIAVIFMAVIAAACYLHPTPDDFDRYMYEANVRSRFQPLETYYPLIRHETPRAASSSAIDTPAHMKEAEVLFAIRPTYLELIYLLSLTGLSIQSAINLISAVSLFCTGLVVLLWTEDALLSVLLIASWQVLFLGRMGTPDGLSTFLILAALWLLEKNKIWALGLLYLGLFVRTDSLLLLLAVLVWLAIWKNLKAVQAALGGFFAIAIVFAINHWTHHPGWIVIFRLSFIGGSVPSQVVHALSAREYLTAFAHGAYGMAAQLALWIFLAVVTWRLGRHPLLAVASLAVIAHFVLYPSPEIRYLLWWCVLVAVLFIRALRAKGVRPFAMSVK